MEIETVIKNLPANKSPGPEDDYISKPFSLREVIARVKAVLRRTATSDTEKAPEQLCYLSTGKFFYY